MIVCDRCNKQADRQVNITPDHGTDLCVSCYQDYRDLIAAFLGAGDFSVSAPDVAASIEPASDPAAHVDAKQPPQPSPAISVQP